MKKPPQVRRFDGVMVDAPVVKGRVVLETMDVRLIMQSPRRFAVVYGLQVSENVDYTAAAKEFGLCVMHSLSCESRLDAAYVPPKDPPPYMRPVLVVRGDKMKCPTCKKAGPFTYIEAIHNARSVEGLVRGTLLIEGFYETEGWDDGEDHHLVCECGQHLDIPDGLETTFG